MKNAFKNIFMNPIRICLVVVHWIVAFFTFAYVPKDHFDRVPAIGDIAFLAMFLLITVDLPA